jgi:hypothetical protein
MKKYIIAARKQQYIVDAENEFRAIQAVIAATDLFACDVDICHLFDSYPVKLQTRLLTSSIIL